MTTLVLHNIRPRSNTSLVPMDMAYLMYYILQDRQVDVARVISNDIKMIVENGHKLGIRPPYSSWGYACKLEWSFHHRFMRLVLANMQIMTPDELRNYIHWHAVMLFVKEEAVNQEDVGDDDVDEEAIDEKGEAEDKEETEDMSESDED
ncbi:hypothetical protein KIW84_056665 [Lathyrus oleraceus]|uniref:Uncharacterized protein n=1 Tax=Pisum sativum TaxID=3888 RepID=A0A9D4X3T3_PEA|nr:hypothetical protein KIW84_056665 [Pisum sativum]